MDDHPDPSMFIDRRVRDSMAGYCKRRLRDDCTLRIDLGRELPGVRGMMAMKPKRIVWSMRTDRELIALSKTNPLEALVDHFKRPPSAILKRAKRLGLSIKRAEG